MYHQEEKETDELRARFTKWLEITLYRARLNYLKKQEREDRLLFMEDLPEGCWEVCEDKNLQTVLLSKDAFCFEDGMLEQAFDRLPGLKQKVLLLLFVEEKKAAEAAELLGCSLSQIYNQKKQAVAELRNLLKGEDTNGKR